MYDDIDLRNHQLDQQRVEQQRQEQQQSLEQQRADVLAFEQQHVEGFRRQQEACEDIDERLAVDEHHALSHKPAKWGGLLGLWWRRNGTPADAPGHDVDPAAPQPSVGADAHSSADRHIHAVHADAVCAAPTDDGTVPQEVTDASGRAAALHDTDGGTGTGTEPLRPRKRTSMVLVYACTTIAGLLTAWQVWPPGGDAIRSGDSFSLGPSGAAVEAPPAPHSSHNGPIEAPQDTPSASVLGAVLASDRDSTVETRHTMVENSAADEPTVASVDRNPVAKGDSMSAQTTLATGPTSGDAIEQVQQKLQRIEAVALDLQAKLQGVHTQMAARPVLVAESNVPQAGGGAASSHPRPLRPVRSAATRPGTLPVAPRAATLGGQLLAVDLWAGHASVVVGTGTPGDQRIRVLRPGDRYNGVVLLSADPAAGTASFQVQGGRSFTLSVQAGG